MKRKIKVHKKHLIYILILLIVLVISIISIQYLSNKKNIINDDDICIIHIH